MDDFVTQIRNRLIEVQQRIDLAAVRSGRTPDSIKLVVVSKKQSVEVIEAAIHAGISYYGENYPEETVPKILALSKYPGIQWHMIGHLQSRKVRLVAEHFAMFHSLDSLALAEKLENALAVQDRQMPALLEVNISGEQSKFGWPAWDHIRWSDLLTDFETISNLPHVQIRGIMTMVPLLDDPEETRPYFARVKALQNYLQKLLPGIDWSELSMGTSSDYEVAIQEGATYVRIGQAVLGSRS